MLCWRSGRRSAGQVESGQNAGRGRSSGGWPGHRSNSYAPDFRCLIRKPYPLHRRLGVSWERDSYRWLAGVFAFEGQEFFAPGHLSQREARSPLGTVAAGSPGDLSAEAMANGNTSGCGQPQASGLLSGRVHVSVQPAQVTQPRKAVLSPRSASRRRRSGDPPPNRSSGR